MGHLLIVLSLMESKEHLIHKRKTQTTTTDFKQPLVKKGEKNLKIQGFTDVTFIIHRIFQNTKYQILGTLTDSIKYLWWIVCLRKWFSWAEFSCLLFQWQNFILGVCQCDKIIYQLLNTAAFSNWYTEAATVDVF